MPHPGHDRSCIRGRYPGSQLRRRAVCRVSRCTAFPGTGPSGMNVHRICLPLRGQRRPCERSSLTCFPFNPVPRHRAPRTQCRRSGTGAHDTTGAAEGPNRRVPYRAPRQLSVAPTGDARVAGQARAGFCGRGLLTPTAACIEARGPRPPRRGQGRSHRSPARQPRRRCPDLGSGQRKPHIRSTSISASMQSASRSRLASRSACRSSGSAASRPAQASSAAQAWGASNRPCR